MKSEVGGRKSELFDFGFWIADCGYNGCQLGFYLGAKRGHIDDFLSMLPRALVSEGVSVQVSGSNPPVS
jgi:hypothetical protein